MTFITLRSATIQDAEIILEWRNDPKTRKSSHNISEIIKDEHSDWLTKTLTDTKRKLCIAERYGVSVGTVRADLTDSIWELSWTVAPSMRSQGVGKRMVILLTQQIFEPIRAEIKVGNMASIRIAEYTGMVFNKKIGRILHYSRGKLK